MTTSELGSESMYFSCDESGGLEFPESSKEDWKVATITGVLFDYKTRCWWKKNYHRFPKKGKNYHDDQIVEILQALDAFKVSAICHVLYQSTSRSEAKNFQNDFISSHSRAINNEPDLVRESRHSHLANFQKMKPETFGRAFALSQLITDGVSAYLNCIGKKRSQDQRNLNIIVDDQINPIVPAAQHFIWYFLNCRSAEGAFTCPGGLPKSLKSHTHVDNLGKTRADLTKFIKIKIGKQGEKLDDRLIELRLADACSNFANRRFREGLSPAICDLLDKIFQHRLVHFGDNDELIANVPETIRLSGIKRVDKVRISPSKNFECISLPPNNEGLRKPRSF
jgi:hypothetical protein